MADILLLIDDLFFLAKVQQTAKLVGVAVEQITPDQLRERAVAEQPKAVILDLNHRSGAAVDQIRTLKNLAGTRGIPLVGFLSHVQGDLAQSARSAGCDMVLARSAFSQQLTELLRRLAGAETKHGR